MNARLPIGVVVLWLAKSALAADWPTFRADALQSGRTTEALPAKLELVWKFETKEAVESTAAIVAGVVYVGSHNGNLHALDLATGKEKWRCAVGAVKAPVSCKDGLVYVGSLDGEFHCVDAASGKKRWTFQANGEITSGTNFAGDRILFGSADRHLYCIDKDGRLLWKYHLPGGPVHGSPPVVGERVYAAGCDRKLHVIDLKTGKSLGDLELNSEVGAAPAIGGDRLFVGTMTTHQVLAINLKDLKIEWTFKAERAPNSFYASPALSDKLVVIGSHDRRVWALDRATGEKVWDFLTERRVTSSPVVAGDRVVVGSLDGKLYVLNAGSGALVQRLDLGAPTNASPAISAGRVVIGNEKGAILCFGERK